jgi:RNA polymerase sigma-70 factor (ECF subfamily)
MDESLPHESISQRMKFRQSQPVSLEGFESVFQENWTPIYRFLIRMVLDPAEAEDLALETFFRLYKNQVALQEEFHTRGWLYKVATHLALQSIRSFKRREHYELNAGKDALEEAHPNQPYEIAAANEDRRFAQITLAGMNPRQAEILALRYSGLTYKEIAQALGLSPTSIGPLLVRAEREFERRYRALTQEAEG